MQHVAFLRLEFFHLAPCFHPCCSTRQYVTPFYCQLIFHCLERPQFVYMSTFVGRWTFGLLPLFGRYEQSGFTHSDGFCVNPITSHPDQTTVPPCWGPSFCPWPPWVHSSHSSQRDPSNTGSQVMSFLCSKPPGAPHYPKDKTEDPAQSPPSLRPHSAPQLSVLSSYWPRRSSLNEPCAPLLPC